jgi:creatinine amidohydrolase
MRAAPPKEHDVVERAHGGNNAVLSTVARDLHVELGLLTYVVHPFLAYVGTSTIDPLDFHAGHSETSVVMHLAPHLVHPDRATANMPDAPGRHVGLEGTVDMGWTSREFGDGSGTIGDPTAAGEADGEKIMDQMVRYAADCITEIAAHASTR